MMILASETNNPPAIEVVELGQGVPFICRRLPPSHKRKERMRPKAAADNQVSNPVGDVKQPSFALDGRHVFQEYRGVQSAPTHDNPSPCSYTEQLETRRRVHAESNSQFANQGCFLPITGLAV